jgi:hypothetical protein
MLTIKIWTLEYARYNFCELILRQGSPEHSRRAQNERPWCFEWQSYFMHVPYRADKRIFDLNHVEQSD